MEEIQKEMPAQRGGAGRKGGNPVVNFLAVLIVVLVLVVAGLGVLYYSQKRSARQLQHELMVEKDSISRSLAKVVDEYDALETTNAGLQAKLQEEREHATKLLAELKEVKQVSFSKIKEYQRELGTLRAIMRKMVGEIDSLNTVNRTLVEENTRMRSEYTESQRSVAQLTDANEKLNEAVSKGSVVHARSVALVALNKKDKVVTRASRAVKLRTCLTLLANSIAQAGPRMVYIRITTPDGVLLADAAGGSFVVDGETIPYSACREVDYQNVDIDVCIYYDSGAGLAKGLYRVEVYTSGTRIGEGESVLK